MAARMVRWGAHPGNLSTGAPRVGTCTATRGPIARPGVCPSSCLGGRGQFRTHARDFYELHPHSLHPDESCLQILKLRQPI